MKKFYTRYRITVILTAISLILIIINNYFFQPQNQKINMLVAIVNLIGLFSSVSLLAVWGFNTHRIFNRLKSGEIYEYEYESDTTYLLGHLAISFILTSLELYFVISYLGYIIGSIIYMFKLYFLQF